MFSHWFFIIEIVTGCSNGYTWNEKDYILSWQRFGFCTRTCSMYIYLYIDVAMCLKALVEILRITLLIIEKCKRH